jgi:hypothetical protein
MRALLAEPFEATSVDRVLGLHFYGGARVPGIVQPLACLSQFRRRV